MPVKSASGRRKQCSGQWPPAFTKAGATALFPAVAAALGYHVIKAAENAAELTRALGDLRTAKELTFLEVRVAIGSRADLGRPTTTPTENRDALMKTLHAV